MPIGQRMSVAEQVMEYMELEPWEIAAKKRELRAKWRALTNERIRGVMRRPDIDAELRRKLSMAPTS